MIFSGYGQTEGSEERVQLNGIIGWDPETKKIKEHIFFSDGGNATAFFEVQGRRMVGTRSGVTGDGAKYSQQLRFDIGKNRWVGAPTKSVGSNGQTLAEYGEYVFTKVK